MNYFLKYRVAIWTIVILSVIILSSVTTVFVLKYKQRDEMTKRQNQIGRFFKEELKLTPNQDKQLKESRIIYFKRSKTIFDSIANKRELMIKELCKQVPDTNVLNHLSDELGALHAELKKASLKNLLDFRHICTPEQIKKLNTINSELIGPDGPLHRMKPNRNPQDKGRKPNENHH